MISASSYSRGVMQTSLALGDDEEGAMWYSSSSWLSKMGVPRLSVEGAVQILEAAAYQFGEGRRLPVLEQRRLSRGPS